jgi:L-ascorbate metabolism protein UlaG (beta-lactamase superfamily)
MQLTKYTHSCVRLDDGDRSLVLDPGMFSEASAALDGADAVLLTHEHPDHVDADAVRGALRRDPRLRLWAPASMAGQFAEFGEQVVPTEPGQAFEAAGFAVRTFGGQHALIHPAIPMIANVGYLIDDAVYHPGDSFSVPPVAVALLLTPLHAPWSKMSEVIDFTVAVRAPRALPIHDALLTETGRGLVEGHLARISAEYGVEYRRVNPAETLDV